MERNWLIRTAQKQILGPIAKSKVLEFIEKGALGGNDEVTSGNGYWFSLKEKNLVDKYLFGDIPQSYNPISEAKSVLATRDDPNKTSSLSAMPLNQALTLEVHDTNNTHTDITKIELSSISEAVKNLKSESSTIVEDIKIPTSDDLEFPDITLITDSVKNSAMIINPSSSIIHPEILLTEKKEVVLSSELDLVYPENEDLDYPDVAAIKEVIASEQMDVNKLNSIEKLELETIPNKESAATLGPSQIAQKIKSKDSLQNTEEKKLLHERKLKSAIHTSTKQEMSNEKSPEVINQIPSVVLPEHLKKQNDNYLMYILVILVLIILSLFFYYYNTILNKPLPV